MRLTASSSVLPGALFTAGSALTAVAVGRISQARGRRPGLAIGYLTGAVGSAGVIIAAVVDNPALLFTALLVYGAGTATNLQARYAGADLAPVGHRARAVSTVLVATTLGGVAGPNLAAPAGTLAEHLGIPHLAGLFVISGTAYALAALVLTLWLRPDPLLLARAVAQAEEADAAANPAATEAADTGEGRGGVVLGALVMVLTRLVMVVIMTMTPVHMHDHGHSTAASGLVIGIHIGAMYLPSPLTGWLVDRYGRMKIAAASAITLLASGGLAALAPGDSIALLALALALLGLGWNFGLVSGTAIITSTNTSRYLMPAPTACFRGLDASPAWCRSCHNGPSSATSSAITSADRPVILRSPMIAARDASPPHDHDRRSGARRLTAYRARAR
ncbi:MFS transporter [Streptomyces sp. NPDC000348]|uniref:MFS transporter n=1 Tax=Streptomyces sp. NPDC000348 TaxID=3364538 RepID=UPI003676990A